MRMFPVCVRFKHLVTARRDYRHLLNERQVLCNTGFTQAFYNSVLRFWVTKVKKDLQARKTDQQLLLFLFLQLNIINLEAVQPAV